MKRTAAYMRRPALTMEATERIVDNLFPPNLPVKCYSNNELTDCDTLHGTDCETRCSTYCDTFNETDYNIYKETNCYIDCDCLKFTLEGLREACCKLNIRNAVRSHQNRSWIHACVISIHLQQTHLTRIFLDEWKMVRLVLLHKSDKHYKAQAPIARSVCETWRESCMNIWSSNSSKIKLTEQEVYQKNNMVSQRADKL